MDIQRKKWLKGVDCKKCGRHVYKDEYTAIQIHVPVVTSKNGDRVTVGSFNLCGKCYDEFEQMLEDWCSST